MDLAYEEAVQRHFIFERTNRYQKVLAMPIGVPQMAFHYREKQYQLSKTVLRERSLAFYRFFLNEFSKLYNTENPNSTHMYLEQICPIFSAIWKTSIAMDLKCDV